MFKARFVLILGLALLCMGSIRKNEDPVVVTEAQTGAISYKQKAEEEKDGVKGAPAPSMTFYAHNKFMTASAVKDRKTEEEESPEVPAKAENTEAGFEEAPAAQDAGAAEKQAPAASPKAAEEEDNWWSQDDEETFSGKTPSK